MIGVLFAMTGLEIKPRTTALLVMDCQEGIIAMLPPTEKDKLLRNNARAIAAARRSGILVVYVVAQFREGYPEVCDRNRMFKYVKDAGLLVAGSAASQVCHELAPQAGDVVVVKRRMNAFAGSDLADVLRAGNIDTLILTGVSSLGVVDSTARIAFDLDFVLLVLGDCCSDPNPEANEIALKWLLPYVATVSSVADFEAALPS